MEEANYLNLENNLRKMVKELLEPTIRRTYENKEKAEQL